MKQPLYRHRRKKQGGFQLLAEDGRGHINCFHAGKGMRYQINLVERFGITPERYFIFGTTVDEIEYR